MKKKVVVTAVIVGFVFSLFLVLSPAAFAKGPKKNKKIKKIDIHSHLHSPVILSEIQKFDDSVWKPNPTDGSPPYGAPVKGWDILKGNRARPDHMQVLCLDEDDDKCNCAQVPLEDPAPCSGTIWPGTDINDHLDLMDKNGIGKSVFSFPSAYLFMRESNHVERRQLSMFINEHFSHLHEQHPKRAFFFANVALSIANTVENMEFSKRELWRALTPKGDTSPYGGYGDEGLGLLGVCIPSNIGGKSLADAEFDEDGNVTKLTYAEFFDEIIYLQEELGRDVPVFIHPESPYGMKEGYLTAYSLFAIVGFPADEARTVASMIYSGFMDKYKKLTFILTHLGGSIPYFYSRLNASPSAIPLIQAGKGPVEYLKDFYYDSSMGNPEALTFLIEFLGSADRIFFGTDHPYVNAAEATTIEYIDKTYLTPMERRKIYRRNAKVELLTE